MATIESKIIIYDDVCPMCRAYTAGFVRLGWLKHRTGFATATPDLLQHVDLDRARHEIPLHDTQTGETLYGLEALFFLIGQRLPGCQPLFRQRAFRAALYSFYQIITFNRRIIAGSRSPATSFDCAPDVSPFYRWLYAVLAFTGAVLVFWPLWPTTSLLPAMLLLHGLAFGIGLCLPKRLDLIGHAATLFLVNALLLSLLPGNLIFQGGTFLLLLWMWRKRLALIA